jgi:hypothetical protein
MPQGTASRIAVGRPHDRGCQHHGRQPAAADYPRRRQALPGHAAPQRWLARGFVPDGYGAAGFQASGVDFPTGGCWEVTGAMPSSSLRFVTLVVKEGA